MNTLDALRAMCDSYPGGREAVALRLGKPDETLRKELRGAPGFKLGVTHAMRIVEFCCEEKTEDRLAFVNVVNGAAHCIALPMPDVDMDGASADVASTLRTLGEAAADFGLFVSAVASSVADNDVSSNELLDVHRKLLAMMAHQQGVVKKLEAIHRRRSRIHNEK